MSINNPKLGNIAMKYQKLLSTLVGIGLATGVSLSFAQATPSRDQVKMERSEFLKSHRYDAGTMDWVLKPGMEAPAGVMTRAEIIAERDKFLSTHRWTGSTQGWVQLQTPREMSKVTRTQVKMEVEAFRKTMTFNNETGQWMPK
jgi:hypothetical protein